MSQDGGDGPTWEQTVSGWKTELAKDVDFEGDFINTVNQNENTVVQILGYLKSQDKIMEKDNDIFYKAAKHLKKNKAAQEYVTLHDGVQKAKSTLLTPGGPSKPPVNVKQIRRSMGKGSGGDPSKL